MSLRAFHLVFIAFSVTLAAFFAAWSVEQYQANSEPSYALAAALALVTAAALVVYGIAFQKKTRRLS